MGCLKPPSSGEMINVLCMELVYCRYSLQLPHPTNRTPSSDAWSENWFPQCQRMIIFPSQKLNPCSDKTRVPEAARSQFFVGAAELRFYRAIAGRHHHNRGFRGNNQRGKKWVKKGAAWMHQISWDIIQMPFRCRSGAIRTPSELKHFHSVQLCLATLRNRKLTRRSWTAPWFLTSLYSRVCFGQWPGIFDMVRACQSWPAKQIPPWFHPLWMLWSAMRQDWREHHRGRLDSPSQGGLAVADSFAGRLQWANVNWSNLSTYYLTIYYKYICHPPSLYIYMFTDRSWRIPRCFGDFLMEGEPSGSPLLILSISDKQFQVSPETASRNANDFCLPSKFKWGKQERRLWWWSQLTMWSWYRLLYVLWQEEPPKEAVRQPSPVPVLLVTMVMTATTMMMMMRRRKRRMRMRMMLLMMIVVVASRPLKTLVQELCQSNKMNSGWWNILFLTASVNQDQVLLPVILVEVRGPVGRGRQQGSSDGQRHRDTESLSQRWVERWQSNIQGWGWWWEWGGWWWGWGGWWWGWGGSWSWSEKIAIYMFNSTNMLTVTEYVAMPSS